MASAQETTEQREYIKQAYGNAAAWCKRVNLMSPEQVYRAYHRIKNVQDNIKRKV